ncbi:MAG TPA: 16S rRNA (guanine(966)-N(2))-methyltransferase RsmD [Myxococcota bacterium]
MRAISRQQCENSARATLKVLRSLRERSSERERARMRITGGEFAGRRLRVPRSAVRPTAERVREALFSMLAHRGALAGARVLDAFAGSGALGLEALSRGAASVLFVEQSRSVAKTLGENVAALGLEARARIVGRDAVSALRALAGAGERFDLCFVDPPYASGLAAETLALLAEGGLLAERAVLVAESDRRHAPGAIAGLSLALERSYGDTLLSLYGLSNSNDDGETRA